MAKGVRGGTGRRHLLFANRPEMDREMVRKNKESDAVMKCLSVVPLKPRTNNSPSLVLV